ncbi:hypothetical protein HDU77_000024 [Chytriomyces hyalinus]|nr:hypothetical protein HDU77_000024 [Chytriomyces hyalinus]
MDHQSNRQRTPPSSQQGGVSNKRHRSEDNELESSCQALTKALIRDLLDIAAKYSTVDTSSHALFNDSPLPNEEGFSPENDKALPLSLPDDMLIDDDTSWEKVYAYLCETKEQLNKPPAVSQQCPVECTHVIGARAPSSGGQNPATKAQREAVDESHWCTFFGPEDADCRIGQDFLECVMDVDSPSETPLAELSFETLYRHCEEQEAGLEIGEDERLGDDDGHINHSASPAFERVSSIDEEAEVAPRQKKKNAKVNLALGDASRYSRRKRSEHVEPVEDRAAAVALEPRIEAQKSTAPRGKRAPKSMENSFSDDDAADPERHVPAAKPKSVSSRVFAEVAKAPSRASKKTKQVVQDSDQEVDAAEEEEEEDDEYDDDAGFPIPVARNSARMSAPWQLVRLRPN